MIRPTRATSSLCARILLGSLCLGGWTSVAQELPEPVPRRVDFRAEVLPILRKSCARCHAGGKRRGGLTMEKREDLVKGGESGRVVVDGKSEESLLIQLVTGQDEERIMPAKGARLTRGEIALLRAWIDQGLDWPEGVRLTLEREAPLALRKPRVPPSRPDIGLVNPIDRLLALYFESHGVRPGDLVDDRIFARRVHLDVIGMLPDRRALDEFLADTRVDKRVLLVRRLLADDEAYAQHWLSFWNDALRNDYRGTGYIDGGRRQISEWLYDALESNRPYDEFVRQLVNPAPGAEGFIKGIVWRGVVNASQRPEMQAAQNISQVFLGINLKCASCHDSFINEWKLEDAYGLANVFAEKPLEMHRCNKPIGKVAPTKFFYPQLGSIDPGAPRKERLEQLAEILTSERNGLFARTIVNRLWARFLGRGLVEPVDEMDRAPWCPELLDWLAVDLIESGHDLKKTIEHILLSRAYQTPSVGKARTADSRFVFKGPLVRRLSAEQLVDGVAELTGVWENSSPAFFPVLKEGIAKGRKSGPPDSGEHAPGHEFVRFSSDVVRAETVTIDADITGARTLWLVVTDGGDGKHFDWADWIEPRLEGEKGSLPLAGVRWRSATSGHGKVQVGRNAGGHPIRLAGKEVKNSIGTHAFSVIVYDLPEGYVRFVASAGPDSEAVEKSRDSGHTLRFMVLTDVKVRASLKTADSLMRALGRPNREQVVTQRESAVTTLQALELTNGATLDALLRKGSERWLAKKLASSQALVEELYRTAFGRRPTAAELGTAVKLVGSPASLDGVHDLLWILTMLPEFQLIY